jgi:hypothetical protein
MSESGDAVIEILQSALDSADLDKKELTDELQKIQKNANKLRKILYKPYEGKKDEPLPGEFANHQKFLKIWDETDRALGNTLLMVMPPSIFEATEQSPPTETEERPQQPIVINTSSDKSEPRQVGGFWSGIWDYQIVKRQLTAVKRVEKPVITTEKVTYDPKAVVHQLIPSFNQIKTLYLKYWKRFTSSRSTSRRLVQLAHLRLKEEMTKYFNVVHPFCIASIRFQSEKIRRDRLSQISAFSRIAEAQAMYPMGMGMGGGPPVKQDKLALQMTVRDILDKELRRRAAR